MPKKRCVLYVETLPNAQGFAYLTYEDGVYYAEYVHEGDIRAKLVISDPTHVLVRDGEYLDLTKVTRGAK